jgi:hypothetical protein
MPNKFHPIWFRFFFGLFVSAATGKGGFPQSSRLLANSEK